MDSIKQSLTENILNPVMDKVGKITTACTFGIKGLAFMKLAQVNEWFTVTISAITILYITFKLLNEINTWVEKRQAKQRRKK